MINTVHLNIGGVPEHFNLPWKLAIDDGLFSIKNIELYWHDYSGGTGDICKALRTDKLDIAIALTEGMVKDIMQGNPATIVQFYVNTPLIWGMHMHKKSTISALSQWTNREFAISRIGSGSHLMAFVLAEQQQWPVDELQFQTVQHFLGALKAMEINPNLIFLWEKFMTKPYVDAGQLKRIGEVTTPWKSFVMAVRNDVLEKHPTAIQEIQEIITTFCYKFKQNSSQSIYALAHNFDLSLDDAKEWFNLTEWNYETILDKKEVEKVKATLARLQLV